MQKSLPITDSTDIIQADYANQHHADDMAYLLNQLALDEAGGAKPLEPSVNKNIAHQLASLPYAFSLLAYVNKEPAALAHCFELFSTFHGRPTINIHDLIVASDHRGQGLSHRLLAAIEEIAITRNCCKITLEVMATNTIAQSSYRKFGFSNPVVGKTLFWQKSL